MPLNKNKEKNNCIMVSLQSLATTGMNLKGRTLLKRHHTWIDWQLMNTFLQLYMSNLGSSIAVVCASDYWHDAPGSILIAIGNFSVWRAPHAHSACHKCIKPIAWKTGTQTPGSPNQGWRALLYFTLPSKEIIHWKDIPPCSTLF